MVLGTVGLKAAKAGGLAGLRSPDLRGLEYGFILILFLTGATGLALRLLGGTMPPGPLLALLWGTVLTFFLPMPYGKFIHGLYRFLALSRYAHDMRTTAATEA